MASSSCSPSCDLWQCVRNPVQAVAELTQVICSFTWFAGNASYTLIDLCFAQKLGLADKLGKPTQAGCERIKASGVVHGVTVDLFITNIKYEIKGMVQ